MAERGFLKLYFHGEDAGAARQMLADAGLTTAVRGADGAASGMGDGSLPSALCRRFPGLGLRGSLHLPGERTDFFSLPGAGELASFRRLGAELRRAEAFSPLWDCDAPFLGEARPDGTVAVAAWARWDARAEVPEALDGRPVTAVGPGAFRGRGTLREVVLPDGVAEAAEDAFEDCPELIVFTDNAALARALAARGVAVRPRSGAVRLATVPYAAGVAVAGVSGEPSRLVVPAEIDGLPVLALADGALRGQAALGELILPEGLVRVGRDACFGCARLRAVALPDSVAEIGESAFQGCAALASVRLPAGLSAVASRAFYQCAELGEVDVPAGVRAIGESAFGGCGKLRRVALPEGLREIAPGAFAGCGALEDMPIPASVERLSADALPHALMPGSLLYLEPQGMLVRADVKRSFALPDGARSLADRALEGCLDLLELTLPDTLERVGDYALSGCEGLRALALPDRTTRVGRGAFLNCLRLREVRLPAGIAELPDEAFRRCLALESPALPEGLVRVGARCFEDCRSLRSLRLPDGVTEVGAHAFFRCEALESLSLPAGLEALGAGALSGCRGLREIRLNGRFRAAWRPVLEEARRAAIIAPLDPPEAFPGLWRKRVCLGYALATARGIGYAAEAEAACIAWMRAHGGAFVAEAARDAHLMHLLADHDCLSLEDVEALLERAAGPDRTEYALTLLDYRNRRFGGRTAPREGLW